MSSLFFLRLIALSLLALILSTPRSIAGNLVANGSFEQGFGGWLGTYGLLNWSGAADGSAVGVVLDLGSSSVGQPMYQFLSTVPGTTYTIDFALHGAGTLVGQQPPGTPAPIKVSWGNEASFFFDEQLGTFQATQDAWQYFSVQATASSSETRLSFVDSYDMNWVLIDGISVQAVPENGSTLALLSFAVLCFFSAKIRAATIPPKK